ncbi:WxL protein peptidoglycan domain-containing protein [Yinghuangia soli]|uniref:DUF916 domain-containing protein n=1 Tax=Yinghuangia soli TaxID=2908204 RepID=A0AA41QB24_9ACTN|nr:DUF916 domain-containing protein [Yinghuangia soli]MCF2534021.1 DUF916 domain-containing protein [Yinghuangia soli]
MKVASIRRTRAPRGHSRGGLRRISGALSAVFMMMGTLFLVLPAQPAAAVGNGEWSIDPLVPDGTTQNSRRYFFLEGAPGTTIQDVAIVANTSQKAITFTLFGSDATNTPRDGGFALDRAEDPRDEVGAWIQIPESQRTLTLQPGQRAQVPFSITIPANARPGDHIGGVVALNNAIEGTKQEGDIQINVQRQIGARVYLRVAGNIVPGMNIENVRIERDANAFFGTGKATIHYTIVNRGNIIVRPRFDVEATGLFGRSLMKHPAGDEIPVELMPGQSVEMRQEWNSAPRFDRVTVKIKATAEDGLVSKSSTSYTAVPWPALLVLAVLLIGAGLAWQYFRRPKGKDGSGDGNAAGPGGAPNGAEAEPAPAPEKPATEPVAAGTGGRSAAPESADSPGDAD